MYNGYNQTTTKGKFIADGKEAPKTTEREQPNYIGKLTHDILSLPKTALAIGVTMMALKLDTPEKHPSDSLTPPLSGSANPQIGTENGAPPRGA
jgi:hypothetical protein